MMIDKFICIYYMSDSIFVIFKKLAFMLTLGLVHRTAETVLIEQMEYA